MANNTTAYGLKPVSAAWGMGLRVRAYYAPASLASLGLGTPVIRAGTANTVSIIPEQLFTIIDDSVGTLAVTDVGLNANLTVGTVNAITGLDSTTLDTTTPATDATFQLKILGLNNRPGNELAAGAEWVVKINNHTDANIVAGV